MTDEGRGRSLMPRQRQMGTFLLASLALREHVGGCWPSTREWCHQIASEGKAKKGRRPSRDAMVLELELGYNMDFDIRFSMSAFCHLQLGDNNCQRCVSPDPLPSFSIIIFLIQQSEVSIPECVVSHFAALAVPVRRPAAAGSMSAMGRRDCRLHSGPRTTL